MQGAGPGEAWPRGCSSSYAGATASPMETPASPKGRRAAIDGPRDLSYRRRATDARLGRGCSRCAFTRARRGDRLGVACLAGLGLLRLLDPAHPLLAVCVG